MKDGITMTHKLVSLSICMLLLALIPLAAGIDITPDADKARVGHTTLYGLIMLRRVADGGHAIKFFALRVHYRTVGFLGEHETGVVMFQQLTIPETFSGFIGKHFVMSSFRGTIDL